MLPRGIIRPSILMTATIMNFLIVTKYLTFPGRQRPNQSDFVFGTTTFRPGFVLYLDGRTIRKTKFEYDTFFTKSNRFGRILDTVINLIRYKRHVLFLKFI